MSLKKCIDIYTLNHRTYTLPGLGCPGVLCVCVCVFKDSWIHHRKQRSHINLLPDNFPKETVGATLLNTLKKRLGKKTY